MLIRALVILLLVLNLGVALWGALATGSTPSAAPADIPPGVKRLQLVTDAAEPDEPTQATAPRMSVIPAQCASFGPYDTADIASALGKRIRLEGLAGSDPGAQVVQTTLRAEPGRAPRSWRVLLPAMSSAAEADAVAKRIVATGFKDYYVIREGDDANAIALGLFRNEQAAQARGETLRNAGFDAVVEPVGAGPEEHWLVIATDAPFDAEAARAQLAAARTQAVSCDDLAPRAATAHAELGDTPAAR